MKKFIILLFSILAFQGTVFSQAPQAINYQAVVRDVNGKELPDGTKLNLKFTILDAGNEVYSETHSNVTTKLGLYNVFIGKGNTADDFALIKWGNATQKTIKIETDIDKDGIYDLSSTSQLVSIPYALFAQAALEKQKLKLAGSKLSILDQDGKEINFVNLPTATYFAGDGIQIVDGAIINTKPDKTVTITGTGGVLVTGTYPNFTVYSDKYEAGAGIKFVSKGSGTYEIEAEQQKLVLNGNNLSITNGNSVTLPSSNGNTYTAGTNVNISASNVISATPTLTLTNGNEIGISGGNKITLPNSGNQWKYEPSNFKYYFTNGTANAIKGVDLHVDNGIYTTDGTNFFSYLGKSGLNNTGILNLRNEKGTTNFLAGFLSGYPNNGAVSCWSVEGTTPKQKILMAVHPNGSGVISTWGKNKAAPQSANVIIGSDPDATPNNLDAGCVYTYSPNGKNLSAFSYLLNYPENGFIAVGEDASTNIPQIGLYLNSSNKASFFMTDGIFDDASIKINSFGSADFFVSGLKQFRVTHPLDETKDIRYTCIEGPEAAMYVRGTLKLKDGKAKVELPEHFRLLAGNKNVTVILMPLSAESEGLAVVKKSKDAIEIVELHRGLGNYEVDYEVKAVRKDYEDNYQVIGDREKSPKMGGFSKTYISELNNAKVEEK
jgi:hypothetical protein